jgi:hypothetical protein
VGIFTVNAANIVLNGNLTQTGSNTTVYDWITVAANNTGTITDMGLLAQTGNTTFAGFRFDVASNAWQVSNSVYANGKANAQSYSTLSTGGAIGGSNTQVQFNNNGQFAANANFTFDYANSLVSVNGSQAFSNIAKPNNVSNAVVVYSNIVGSGGTGLYFTSSSAADELVSKSKAIVYGIIF